jgi:hypothetical protein
MSDIMAKSFLRIYADSVVRFNDTPVKFLAFEFKGLPTGPYRIKYQIQHGEDFGKLHDMGLDLSLEQWQHFQHDINPTAPLHYYLRSAPREELYGLPDHIRTVIEGYAEHLGRGNSWNGYKVNGLVVKLSSIVPYVWQNSHAYRSSAESAAQAQREIDINQILWTEPKLRDRINPITQVDYIAQKVAVTMPYLEPVDQVTEDQALYLEETLRAMHRLGYAYCDQELGFGLDPQGIPKIYDLSTVHHRSEASHVSSWHYWIEDDLDVIRRLREKHHLPESPNLAKARRVQRQRHDAWMDKIKAKV